MGAVSTQPAVVTEAEVPVAVKERKQKDGYNNQSIVDVDVVNDLDSINNVIPIIAKVDVTIIIIIGPYLSQICPSGGDKICISIPTKCTFNKELI